MSDDDPIDVHRALQKAARELAFYADNGHRTEYFAAIDRLEAKLKAVRAGCGGQPTMSAPNNDELCFRCGHERRHHGFKCGDPSHDHGPLSCNERATTPDGRATVPICPCHEFLPQPRPKVAAMRICEYCGSSLRAEQYYRQLPDDHQPLLGNQP